MTKILTKTTENHGVKKTSVSLSYDNWAKIQDKTNKSAVVNAALAIYFDRESYLNSLEQKYWDNVANSLLAKNQDYKVLVAEDEVLTDDLLADRLWS